MGRPKKQEIDCLSTELQGWRYLFLRAAFECNPQAWDMLTGPVYRGEVTAYRWAEIFKCGRTEIQQWAEESVATWRTFPHLYPGIGGKSQPSFWVNADKPVETVMPLSDVEMRMKAAAMYVFGGMTADQIRDRIATHITADRIRQLIRETLRFLGMEAALKSSLVSRTRWKRDRPHK